MKKWQQTFFELLFEILFENSPEGIAIVDPESRVMQANAVFCSMFGYSMDEVIGEHLDKLVASDGSIREEASEITHAAHKGEQIVRETRRQRRDGTIFDVAISILPVISEGEVTAVYGIYRDISDRKNAQKETERQMTYFENLFRSSPFAIALIRETGDIIRVNEKFEDLFGFSEAECTDRNLDELIVPPEDRGDARTLTATTLAGSRIDEEKIRVRSDGTRMLCSIRAVRFDVPGEAPLIYGIYEDITQRRMTEEHIRFLSFHDSLTGLYNRAFLEEEMDRLDTARQLPLSIIVADVDNLKLVNDILGHDEGDALLKNVAHVLKSCCRKEDIVARHGGDEFSVLLPGTEMKKAEEICSRVRSIFSDSTGHIVSPGLSMGVAARTDLTQKIMDVRKKADENMYRDKMVRRKEIKADLFLKMKERLVCDNCRRDHASGLSDLCALFAKTLGLDSGETERLRSLAEYHDVGFTAIPLEISEKNGPLSEEEWSLVRRHPEKGFQISRNIPEISFFSEEILSHHERFDGKGYPRGLQGENIPKLTRIFSVVDAFFAMTKTRCYKPLLSYDEALEEISNNAGSQFDPGFAGLFIDMVRSGKAV